MASMSMPLVIPQMAACQRVILSTEEGDIEMNFRQFFILDFFPVNLQDHIIILLVRSMVLLKMRCVMLVILVTSQLGKMVRIPCLIY